MVFSLPGAPWFYLSKVLIFLLDSISNGISCSGFLMQLFPLIGSIGITWKRSITGFPWKEYSKDSAVQEFTWTENFKGFTYNQKIQRPYLKRSVKRLIWILVTVQRIYKKRSFKGFIWTWATKDLLEQGCQRTYLNMSCKGFIRKAISKDLSEYELHRI